MSLLTRIGGSIVANSVIKVARRIAREAKIKREARMEGYRQGYLDAEDGQPPKYRLEDQ